MGISPMKRITNVFLNFRFNIQKQDDRVYLIVILALQHFVVKQKLRHLPSISQQQAGV